jgi:Protein of unknown function (DUF3140)
MKSDELEAWLSEEQSEISGWSKPDGSGETIGHERLTKTRTQPPPPKTNTHNSLHLPTLLTYDFFLSPAAAAKSSSPPQGPWKDPSKYDQDDIAHMRRVAAYCKRHLAQEEKAKHDTNSKSYKSLKNWGHDAHKT